MNNESRFTKLMQMLMAQPDDVFLHYAIAMEYKGMGKDSEAKEWLMKTLELDATHVPAYHQLGLMFMQANDNAGAAEYLTKGLEYARQKNDRKAMREIQALLDEMLYD